MKKAFENQSKILIKQFFLDGKKKKPNALQASFPKNGNVRGSE